MNIDRFTLTREQTALMVIDIQERLAAAMEQTVMEKVTRNTGILIETAQLFGMPVIVSEQYRKGLGPTIGPIKERLSGVALQEKLHFDCTKDDQLANTIKASGRKKFILTGIEAHVCVFQTGLSLLGLGYEVVVANDAVASRRTLDWEYGLKALGSAGAVVYPTETIAFLLLEKAGTQEFKKLSPLFK